MKKCQIKSGLDNMFSRHNFAIIGAGLIWSFVVFVILFSFTYIPGIDPDSFYHIRMADIMASQGLVIKKFLWTTCCILNEHFFDKDWLFHVYLVPFVSYFNDVSGAKYALCILVFLSAVTWGSLARGLKIRYVFLTLLLIGFVTCSWFIGRFILCRAHVFSIMILPLCILCIVKGRRSFLLILAAVYSLGYSGSWQIIPIAAVYDLTRRLIGEKVTMKSSMSLWAAAGIVLGTFINPYFPNNIYGGFLQNIMVLKSAEFGIPGFKYDKTAIELHPMRLISLLVFYTPLLLCHASAAITVITKFKAYRNTDLIFTGIISIVYLILNLFISKFTDYYVPLAVIFIMCFLEHISNKIPKILKNIAVSFIILALMCSSILSIRLTIRSNFDRPTYVDDCYWLNMNVKTDGKMLSPQKVIFTAGWDDAPFLFYGCPQFRYLVMLDPYFMYVYSKDKYRLVQQISEGETPDPASLIKKEFGADIIFVSQFYPKLQRQLDQNPGVELKYTGNYCEKIYFIRQAAGDKPQTN